MDKKQKEETLISMEVMEMVDYKDKNHK